jgi:hypothetical protein
MQNDNLSVWLHFFSLQSYDSPLPAPPLWAVKPVMPVVTNEMLCNRSALLDGLKNSFRALLEYAQ